MHADIPFFNIRSDFNVLKLFVFVIFFVRSFVRSFVRAFTLVLLSAQRWYVFIAVACFFVFIIYNFLFAFLLFSAYE